MTSRHRTAGAVGVATLLVALALGDAKAQSPAAAGQPATAAAATLPRTLLSRTATAMGSSEVAVTSLASVLEIARLSQTLSILGLEPGEPARATLGPPIPLVELGYDALLTFRAGDDASRVFTGPPQVAYLVLLDGKPRSSLTFVQRDGTWKLAAWGDVLRTAAIGRAVAANGGDVGQPGTILLVAPAFRIELVARQTASRVVVTPVDPAAAREADLRGTGELEPVLAKLADYARAFEQRYGSQVRAKRLAR